MQVNVTFCRISGQEEVVNLARVTVVSGESEHILTNKVNDALKNIAGTTNIQFSTSSVVQNNTLKTTFSALIIHQ